MLLTKRQIEIIEGHLLGDGHMIKRWANASFSIERSILDKDYSLWTLNELNNIITPIGLRERKRFNKKTNKTSYSCELLTKSLPDLNSLYERWYINKKKVVPKDLILTPLMIGIWICDDGHITDGRLRYKNSKSLKIRFSTDGFKKDEVIFLSDQLKIKYGENIKNYKIKDKNQWIIEIGTTSICKKLLRDINSDFPPLKRKSDIWNRKDFDLYDEIPHPIHPACPSCKKIDCSILYGFTKNRIRRYFCKECKIAYKESS